MPSATSPPPTTHPDITPFPSPSTFSILPEIYLLLTRLDVLQNAQSQSIKPTSSLLPATPRGTTLPPITTKDLPTLTHPIKQKIAKARTAVQALPDVDRSLEEQEEEIRMLEARVAALKGRLGELGRIAGSRRDREVESGKDMAMAGMEG